MRDLTQTFDLPTVVEAHKQDVVNDAQKLWSTMEEVDLVLCATDNIASRRLINYICVSTMTPLVMACTFRNARIGEIIRVLPGETACYECTRLALHEAGSLESVSQEDDRASVDSNMPYSLAENNSITGVESANQGTRADVAIIAALLSRIAIMTLLSNAAEVDRLPRNYMTWGGRVETGLPDPFNFERPFSTNWVPLARREDCPVCGEIGKLLDSTIDEEYQALMGNLQPAPSN